MQQHSNMSHSLFIVDMPVFAGRRQKAAQPQVIVVWSAARSGKAHFMSHSFMMLLAFANISVFYPFSLV